MKRLTNVPASLFLLGALAAGISAAAANLPSDWPREQPFDVPTTGLLKISLPLETLDRARPALEDVRLYDDAGIEILYLIERPAPTPNVIQNAGSFRVSLTPDNTVITLDTGLAQPLDGVAAETPANDFIKAVRVENSDDGQRWQVLAQGRPVFRRPDGVGQLHVSLPAIISPWLRLTIDDRRSPPIPFTAARMHAATSEAAAGEWFPAGVSERDENPGETRLALNLGAANLDLAALQIETTEPLFMRQVALAVPQVSEDSVRERRIAQGVVYRVDVQGQTSSEQLSLPLENQIRSREVFLLIKNGDSPPLPISGVRVERRPVYLVFLARQPGMFHLLTGNRQCGAPHYDLAASNLNLKSVAASPIKIPPPSNNPNFRAREVLSGIELAGAALDVSEWRFRKPVKISGAGRATSGT